MTFQPIYPTLNRRRRETLVPYNQGGQGPFVLDFTTGVFDPRLSFSRASNATFINSSGQVQYADANMMRNSSWSDSNPVPTSWTGTGNTPTIPATGSRTFTVTTAATSYIAESGAAATGSHGLIYTAAVEVTAVSGSPTYNNTILATASPTNVSWYRNGTPVNGTEAVQTGVISYVFTSGTNSFIRIGLGASGGSVTNQSITMTKPRLMPGVRVDSPYFPSASATEQYQAPRFECLNGVIQGFLVEAPNTNTINWSETFFRQADDPSTTYPWADTDITRNSTNNASPMAGLSNALRITASADEAYIRNSSNSMATDTWTFSIWLRRVSGTGNIELTVDGGATWHPRTITSSWARYSLTASGTGWVGVKIAISGDSIELWGAQRETRPTATSYIPAGRSTATRAADYCTMPTSSFIFGPPSKITMFVEAIPNNNGTTYPDYVRLFDRVTNFGHGLELYGYGTSTLAIQRKVTASTSTDRPSNSGLAYNTRHKFALSADSGGFFGSADGVSGASATTAPAAFPASVTHLGVGCNGDASPVLVMFGILRYIRIWPYAFSQAALNELTTL